MVDIKDRIREGLTARGMTAAELARKSGVDKSAISRYLKGDFLPKQFAIGKMATALNVSPAWLMGYDVTMEGEEVQPQIEVHRLTPENQALLRAYYQALIDSQGDNV